MDCCIFHGSAESVVNEVMLGAGGLSRADLEREVPALKCLGGMLKVL